MYVNVTCFSVIVFRYLDAFKCVPITIRRRLQRLMWRWDGYWYKPLRSRGGQRFWPITTIRQHNQSKKPNRKWTWTAATPCYIVVSDIFLKNQPSECFSERTSFLWTKSCPCEISSVRNKTEQLYLGRAVTKSTSRASYLRQSAQYRRAEV